MNNTVADGLISGLVTYDNYPEWFLAARTAANGRHGSIMHEGCRIAYQAWGEPEMPPLHLLHGAGASSEWWEATAILLADSYHIVAPSLSGCGQSEWRERYRIDQSVEEALACAREEFGPEPHKGLACAAHSFGSEVGVRLAIDPSKPVSRLILVDSLMGLYSAPATSFQMRKRQFYKSQDDAVSRYSTVPRDDYGPPFLRRHIALQSLEEIATAGGEDRWSWRADPNVMVRLECHPIFERLGEVRCPVDFIYGGKSSMNSADLRDRQANVLSGRGQFHGIDEAGHHIPLDRPHELASAMRQILAQAS